MLSSFRLLERFYDTSPPEIEDDIQSQLSLQDAKTTITVVTIDEKPLAVVQYVEQLDGILTKLLQQLTQSLESQPTIAQVRTIRNGRAIFIFGLMAVTQVETHLHTLSYKEVQLL